MKPRRAVVGRGLFIAAVLDLLVVAPSVHGQQSLAARTGTAASYAERGRNLQGPAQPPAAAPRGSVDALLRLPLSFEPAPSAEGGVAESSFVARGPGYTVSLSPAAAIIVLTQRTGRPHADSGEDLAPDASLRLPGRLVRAGVSRSREAGTKASFRSDARGQETERSSPDILKLELVSANASARAEGLDALPGRANYFVGSNPKVWRTNVPTFARVRYESVYPGVDLVYYGNPQLLEFDFIVKPGADVTAIRFAVRNAAEKERALEIGVNGDLVIPTAHGEVRLRRPVIYQEQPGNGARGTGARTPVEGRYVLTSAGEVRFDVSDYDQDRPLVIDPTLEYSSFLGGSGWDFGVSAGVGVDSAGNLYVASGTASADFPGTSGGFQGTSASCNLGGNQLCGDAFVTKINPSGTAVLYSTYVGGAGADGAYGLAVDAAGNAYVAGPTDSTDFPTTPAAFQTVFGGDTPGCASGSTYPPCGDAYVTKLDPDGVVVYSTYLGGSADDYAEAVAVDGSGNAYVTGQTRSGDFPTTPGAYQETTQDVNCAPNLCGTMFVAKLTSAGSALAYSTYVGGGSGSFGAGIDVDAAGSAYVTGSANWNDFPTTPNAYKPDADSGGSVLVRLDDTGSSLLYSTHLDGSSWGLGLGVAVDAGGIAYMGGLTNSSNFPVTAGAFQSNLTNWTGFHAYVAKLDTSKSGESSLVFSSLFGGSGSDAVTDVAFDSAGRVYFAGGTTSPDFPTVRPLQGTFATDPGCTGCEDGFVAVLSNTGSQLLFSTFLGGTGDDGFDSLALDSEGSVYVGGGTASPRHPTTADAFQTIFADGGSDMIVAKIRFVNNTTIGIDVEVPLTGHVNVTFDQVTVGGTTAVTETAVGPAAPGGFVLGSPAAYFDISTTATFSGAATVCLGYAGITFPGGEPEIFHHENDSWVNVTTSVDSANEIVCGSVTSFSPFALFVVYSASVQAPIASDGTSTFKARRGSVPVKFAVTLGGEPTCDLLPATISIHRESGSVGTGVNEDVYQLPPDTGSQFRIDPAACQYVYNLDARSLGPGTYRVEISISGTVIGSAKFVLQ